MFQCKSVTGFFWVKPAATSWFTQSIVHRNKKMTTKFYNIGCSIVSDIENMSKKCVINKKTAVERPAVKYLKYELAQRPIIDKLQLH